MKANNKNKKIIFIISSIMCVSVLSVGLSTWVAGIEVKNDSDYATIEVDSVSNQSKFLDIVFANGEKIVLSENTTGDVWKNDGSEADFELDISSSRVMLGKGLSGNSPTVSLSKIEFNKENFTYNNINTGIFYNNNGSQLSYIKLKSSYQEITCTQISENDLSESEKNLSTNYIFYKLDTTKIEFEWGSAFNNESPCTYLNDEYSKWIGGEGVDSTNLDKAQKIADQENFLNVFKNAFDSLKMTFFFTLNI